VKTITLDEESYALLKSWKRKPKDSFSSVVKQVVPRPGTMGSMLSYLEYAAPGDVEKDRILEETVQARSGVKEDPWT
jgi:predicted CopG family antitoxin